jgi:hypothetical protein
MAEPSVHRTMNTDTFEALQAAGFDSKQATVLATAIPDIEPPLERLRSEMDLRFAELRGEMDHRFAGLERRLNAQTWAIVGTLVAIGGLVAATNLWG